MISAFFLSTALFASTPLDHPLDVSELVEMALEHNPKTKTAWWAAKRAQSAKDLAKSSYFPKLDLSLGALHGKEYEFINGPNRKFTETSAELSLSYLLFDFGERSCDVKAHMHALQAANWQRDFVLQEVMIQTLDACYRVLHAQEVVLARKVTEDDAREMLHLSEELQKAGFTSLSDVYSSRSLLAEMQMEHAKARRDFDIYKAKLAELVGMKQDSHFEVAPVKNIKQAKKEDIQELFTRAMSQRKDLQAKAAKLKEADMLLDKSYASYLPKLSALASGGITEYHQDSSKKGNYTVGLTLDIPLFSGLESIYKTRIAHAERESTLSELAEMKLAICQEVLTAKRTHEAAEEILSFVESAKENAYLAYRASLERYKAGKEGMFQETSHALMQLAEARIRYSEVKTEWLTSLASLAYATGTL